MVLKKLYINDSYLSSNTINVVNLSMTVWCKECYSIQKLGQAITGHLDVVKYKLYW